MKKSKITLLVASLLGLAVGVGGAFAATQFTKAEKHVDTTFDQSLYLYWGAGETEVEIDDVNQLTSDKSEYRYIVCQPAASSSFDGKVVLTYTISGETKDTKVYSLEGLTVKVYAGVSKPAEGDPVLEGDPELTLVYGTKNSGTTEFEIEDGEGSASYCLEFIYSGAKPAEGHEWGGLMTISQALDE